MASSLFESDKLTPDPLSESEEERTVDKSVAFERKGSGDMSAEFTRNRKRNTQFEPLAKCFQKESHCLTIVTQAHFCLTTVVTELYSSQRNVCS